MAAHQFGIMNREPLAGERYDKYEPEKYDLISIRDDLIETIINDFKSIKCFCHTLDISCRGLVYSGITLIPPYSAGEMAESIKNIPGFNDFKIMLLKAESKNKFIIHYGL